MRYKRIKLSLMLFFSLWLTGLQAQETVTTTGGNGMSSLGSVSYTIGQVFYTTQICSNGSVAQGVQQPYEISVSSGIDEAKGITLQCLIYPNPTNDIITLKVENIEFSALSFQLYDINGKLVENRKLESNETKIVFSNLVSATYFLKVVQMKYDSSSQEIKSFKIIKN